MKKIAIFSHKGGVSKTTTAFHLGWSLAQQKRNVLLVDTDAQCNLTEYAMGYNRYAAYYAEKRENINDCLRPAYQSEPKTIQPAECYRVDENLYLLPGSLDFTENEVQLSIAMQLKEAFSSMRNLPGALSYLVEATGDKYQIDYVIFDMNPSMSAINKNVFISSDYFIIPTAPDIFSVFAIQSLSRILPQWEAWRAEASRMFSKATYKLQGKTPKFLGYTINNYNLSNGRPQKNFKAQMEKISDCVTNTLLPQLAAAHMVLPENAYQQAYGRMMERLHHGDGKTPLPQYEDCYCLAQISNFNKLIAKSQEESRPVFDLNQMGMEGFTDNQKRTYRWFGRLYQSLTERIMELTE